MLQRYWPTYPFPMFFLVMVRLAITAFVVAAVVAAANAPAISQSTGTVDSTRTRALGRITALVGGAVVLFDNSGVRTGIMSRIDFPAAGISVVALKPGFLAIRQGERLVWLRRADVTVSDDTPLPCTRNCSASGIRVGGDVDIDPAHGQDVQGSVSGASAGMLIRRARIGAVRPIGKNARATGIGGAIIGNEPVNDNRISSKRDDGPQRFDSPFLPWPPPKPASLGEISGNFAIAGRMIDLDRQLRTLLMRKGYENLRYFSIDGGFAVTTQVERLDAAGAPASPRWTTEKIGGFMNFFDYVRRLIQGERNPFRLFVIAVTDRDMGTQSFQATGDDVKRWDATGRPALSVALANMDVGKQTRVWLLVYELGISQSRAGALEAPGIGRFPFSFHASSLGLRP